MVLDIRVAGGKAGRDARSRPANKQSTRYCARAPSLPPLLSRTLAPPPMISCSLPLPDCCHFQVAVHAAVVHAVHATACEHPSSELPVLFLRQPLRRTARAFIHCRLMHHCTIVTPSSSSLKRDRQA